MSYFRPWLCDILQRPPFGERCTTLAWLPSPPVQPPPQPDPPRPPPPPLSPQLTPPVQETARSSSPLPTSPLPVAAAAHAGGQTAGGATKDLAFPPPRLKRMHLATSPLNPAVGSASTLSTRRASRLSRPSRGAVLLLLGARSRGECQDRGGHLQTARRQPDGGRLLHD